MQTKSYAEASNARNTIKKRQPLSYPPRDIRTLSLYIFPFTVVSIIVSPAHLAYGLLRSFPRPHTSTVSLPQSHDPLPVLFWLIFGVCLAVVGCVCFAGLWYLWFSVPRTFAVSDRWDPARVTLYEITLCYSLLALGFVWVAFSVNLPFLIAYWTIRMTIHSW